MKKHISLILFILLVGFAQGQTMKNFSKEISSVGNVLYAPLFEENELQKQGKYLESFAVSPVYIQEWIGSILSQVLSAGEIRQLERQNPAGFRKDTITNSYAGIFFDHTGKVGFIFFALSPKDTALLDDRKLTKLYHLMKKTAIDMSKGRIIIYWGNRKNEECYFLLMQPLYTWRTEEKEGK